MNATIPDPDVIVRGAARSIAAVLKLDQEQALRRLRALCRAVELDQRVLLCYSRIDRVHVALAMNRTELLPVEIQHVVSAVLCLQRIPDAWENVVTVARSGWRQP